MKKITKLMVIFLSALFFMMQITACSGPSGTKDKVDEGKSQLYIGNMNGGMGSAWLDTYKKAFEEAYKNESFETGKKGVEVVVKNDKETYKAGNIVNAIRTKSSTIDLYFTELFDYYDAVKEGLLLDITDIVKDESLSKVGEDKKIIDKLSDEQKTYYSSYDGKYYALPHYSSYRGIVYDKDLFDAKGPNYTKIPLYIEGDPANNNYALYEDEKIKIGKKSTDSGLSCGPDGITGTSDDGLPATYQEFFDWCYVIQDSGVTPICWNGKEAESYIGDHLFNALFADVMGKDATKAYFNIPTEPVNVDVIDDFDGEIPSTVSIPFSRGNYKEYIKMVGNYYQYKFFYELTDGQYYQTNSTSSSQTHELTHEDFLYGNYEDNGEPIAMMVEGTWWEEESAYYFDAMVKEFGNGASRKNRNFGFMPLPKIDYDHLGAQTLLDANKSITFISANSKGKVGEELAKLFLQFISTDSNLQLFATTTGMRRDYKCDLTPSQIDQLSTFAKDIYKLQEDGNIVYGYSTSYSNYYWDKSQKQGIKVEVNGRTPYSLILEPREDDPQTAKEFYLKTLDLIKTH